MWQRCLNSVHQHLLHVLLTSSKIRLNGSLLWRKWKLSLRTWAISDRKFLFSSLSSAFVGRPSGLAAAVVPVYNSTTVWSSQTGNTTRCTQVPRIQTQKYVQCQMCTVCKNEWSGIKEVMKMFRKHTGFNHSYSYSSPVKVCTHFTPILAGFKSFKKFLLINKLLDQQHFFCGHFVWFNLPQNRFERKPSKLFTENMIIQWW